MREKNPKPQEGLTTYMRDVRKTHPLTPEEERRLGHRVQAGDLVARNKLVTANLRFGVAMAKGYQGRGLSLDELISAANTGLIEAAARYDSRRGARFITYASWWIRRAVFRAFNAHDKLVHLPAHVQDLIRKVQRTVNELHAERERKPCLDEIVERSEEPVSRVLMALENVQEMESLDRDQDGFPDPERRLAGELYSPLREPPTTLDRLAEDDQVRSLLAELSDRESAVVCSYYGLGGRGEGNLAEIGRSMDLSRERVRQIKSSALRRMKKKANEQQSVPAETPVPDDVEYLEPVLT
jgi:RNA polymerase primary sigma factor